MWGLCVRGEKEPRKGSRLGRRALFPGQGCVFVSVCDSKSCSAHPTSNKCSGVHIRLSADVGPDPSLLPPSAQGFRPQPPPSDPGLQTPASSINQPRASDPAFSLLSFPTVYTGAPSFPLALGWNPVLCYCHNLYLSFSPFVCCRR